MQTEYLPRAFGKDDFPALPDRDNAENVFSLGRNGIAERRFVVRNERVYRYAVQFGERGGMRQIGQAFAKLPFSDRLTRCADARGDLFQRKPVRAAEGGKVAREQFGLNDHTISPLFYDNTIIARIFRPFNQSPQTQNVRFG